MLFYSDNFLRRLCEMYVMLWEDMFAAIERLLPLEDVESWNNCLHH